MSWFELFWASPLGSPGPLGGSSGPLGGYYWVPWAPPLGSPGPLGGSSGPLGDSTRPHCGTMPAVSKRHGPRSSAH